MKKILSVLVIALALLGVLVVPALAGKGGKGRGARKAPFYWVNGSSNYPTTDLAGGQVVLVAPMGSVSLLVQGNVKGLDANADYDVWIRNLTGYTGSFLFVATGSWKGDPYTYYKLTTFTTDGEGNGSFHLNLRADDLPEGTYEIQVAINEADNHSSTLIATQWDPGLIVTVKSQ